MTILILKNTRIWRMRMRWMAWMKGLKEGLLLKRSTCFKTRKLSYKRDKLNPNCQSVIVID